MSARKGISGGLGLKKNFFLILASLVTTFNIGIALNLKPLQQKTTLVSKIQTPPPAVLSVPEKKVSGQGPARKSSSPETDTKDTQPIKGTTKKTSESYGAIGAKVCRLLKKQKPNP